MEEAKKEEAVSVSALRSLDCRGYSIDRRLLAGDAQEDGRLGTGSEQR